jgi:Na+-transporting NADH:ubiquinone oxidoreductase subunit C
MSERMQMSAQSRSITFAVILCVVCSLLLTAASTGLRSLQERNTMVDRQKNILRAFGIVAEDQKLDAQRVEQLYQQSVNSLWVKPDGRIVEPTQHNPGDLPLYVYTRDDAIQAYAVPIDTRGLWGQIQGYLALENDGSTIRGFTVYQHAETPGLGGEIESRWFRANFAGKKITDRQGDFVSIKIAKGKVAEVVPEEKKPNYVDGISGATLTGKFLSAGMEDILKTYEPVSINFRHNQARYLRVQ